MSARRALAALAALLAAGPARAATYYVSTSGSDSNTGTLAAPFRTVQHGLGKMASGDTLYLRAGTYAETFYDGVPSGGSWSAPTTIAAYPGETVTLQPASGAYRVFTFTNAHYIVLDRLVMDARNVTYEGIKLTYSGSNTADHIRVQNSEIMNSPAQGVYADQTSPSNEFLNDKIHDNGISDFDHGLYLDGSYNIVDHCDIYRNAGWGVHIYNGYAGGRADGNIIRFNRIHDNARTGGRGAGIILSSGNGNTAHDNLIWNNAGGVQVDYGATGTKILNNTVYNNNGATSQWGVYLGNGTPQGGGSTAASGTIVQNNILFQNSAGGIVSVQSGVTASNNLTIDPLFVGASAANFQLSSGSPAIDKGLNLSAQGVTTDFAGVSRPQGAAFDIGAYEYAGSGAGTTSLPPGCYLGGSAAWTNVAVTQQTGAFTLQFDATPSMKAMDGAMGASNGPATGYASLAAAVRSTNAGTIDARKGRAYAAATTIPYAAGTTYHFRLAINLANHTYSAYVTPKGGAEVAIGANYAFRTEQAAVTALNNLGLATSTGNETVCAVSAAAAASAPPGCTAVSTAWANAGFASQAGAFTLQFDATPSMASMDGLLGASNGAAAAYTALAAIVRFNNTGTIDARNGGAYAAAAAIPYSAGKAYHFRLVINVPSHVYSAYVTPSGGGEVLIGANYAFRTEQAAATALSNLGAQAAAGGATVCTVAASAATLPSITAVAAGGITSSGAAITWTTSVAADSAVDYGPTAAYGATTPTNGSLTTAHAVTLSGLGSATLYHYRARSKDSSGNLATSADATFTTAGSGCASVAAGAWKNEPFSAQSGSFTAQFDAKPGMALMDGIVGLSNGAASAYSSLAAAVRFNNTGKIDARNGGAYAAAASVPYSAGVTYHFRLVVSVSAHTYSAYVTPPGGVETLLGAGYAFRTEQASVRALSNLALYASTGSESVCALTSAGVSIPLQ